MTTLKTNLLLLLPCIALAVSLSANVKASNHKKHIDAYLVGDGFLDTVECLHCAEHISELFLSNRNK